MPRFVLLEHDHPERHWDLMLESGAVLRTWRLPTPPRNGAVLAATANFDHRQLYLDYEGPISGGRGHVIRCDWGTFTWETQTENCVVVRLNGQRLHGILRLEQGQGVYWNGEFTADTAELGSETIKES